MSAPLVYRCFHIGASRPCFYNVSERKVYWRTQLDWQIRPSPPGFTEFYAACDPPPDPEPDPAISLESSSLLPSVTVDPVGPTETVPPDFFSVTSPPSLQFLSEPHFPPDLFILNSAAWLKTWASANCRFPLPSNWFENSHTVVREPFLLLLSGITPQQALEPVHHLLRFAYSVTPAESDQHLLGFLKCAKVREILPQAGVALMLLTNTLAFHPALGRLWDAFLLFSATVERPFKCHSHIRAYLTIVASCRHSHPVVASSALACLFRLSAPCPVRVPLNEDRPTAYLRAYARQPGAPATTGVSLAEAVHADAPPRTALVPAVLRRLLAHIGAHGGLELMDLFTHRTDRRPSVVARIPGGNLDSTEAVLARASAPYL
jgi:hypothetical protein